MPRYSYRRKTITSRHWEMIKDYCDGERLRDIEDKYKVYSGTITEVVRQIGITPRPSGFASYKVARKWVLKAQKEYEEAFQTNQQQRSPVVAEDNQHYS